MDFKIDQIELYSSIIYLLEYVDSFDPSLHLDTLTVKEKERFLSFKSEKRKREFVATRILKHQLFSYQEIKYEEHGAPYFDSKTYISISHGKNIVGIAANEHFQIGFDIEQIREKVLRIAPKFLNSAEKTIFDTSNPTEITASWSFKESLYKLAGRKLIDFKKELLLLEKNKNLVKAKIINPKEEILAELLFFEYKGNVITINVKAVEYIPK
jgi:phosphopantetheinyl transferase